jgi:hypothetical protein
MEHTITQGEHYYMSSCVQASCHESVHSFVRRFTVTNQLHYQTQSLLRRLLRASVEWFVSGQWESGLAAPLHIIDPRTSDGLMDIIALGNLVEFSIPLDLRTYENVIVDTEERLEQEAAMTHYRRFIRWFSSQFGLLIGGTAWVNPTYIFKRCLISFGASVGDYFTREHPTVQRQDPVVGISPSAVRKKLRHHIQSCWSEMVPAFDILVTNPSPFLYYTGPPIRIIRKLPLLLVQEGLLDRAEDIDYLPAPIFHVPEHVSPPETDHAAQKRDRILTSPATSPSQRKVSKIKK